MPTSSPTGAERAPVAVGWLRETFGGDGGRTARRRALVGLTPAGDSPNWRKLGNEALAAGDLAEALRCYEQGALVDPRGEAPPCG